MQKKRRVLLGTHKLEFPNACGILQGTRRKILHGTMKEK
jgi:hypothetical protein